MAIRAVVSILDESHYAQVEALWDLLENECGLRAMREVAVPHFSWHIAEDYDFEALKNDLQAMVQKVEPFEVTTNGLGVFTGDRPVVYLQVIRSPQLASMHRILWESVQAYSTGLNPYYAPDAWMPHITLASRDVDVDSLACVMRQLGERAFNWKIRVDNYALVVQEEGQTGYIHSKYRFLV